MNILKKTGFTLLELITVIIIIGILALVAIQVYRVLLMRAIATEGKTLMGTIARAEKTYYVENGTFYGYKSPSAEELGISTTGYGSDEEYNAAVEAAKKNHQDSATGEGGQWATRSKDDILGIDARGNKYFRTFTFSTGSDTQLWVYSQSDEPYNGFQCILTIQLPNDKNIDNAQTKIRIVDTGHNIVDETME